ncbi:UNKNOWN [Stylonychia lemnae]|uniref:STI1/HOP DP domain-containing protein n=1 Tax=Stylonychia lemnae TaxID=5949 RepID=A0A078AV85_STYLE|nr:UNKNOWN [Stylonychia lemnae]|eukprot:CDW86300.1 UNKNOWN [Stylonychia lemnae]
MEDDDCPPPLEDMSEQLVMLKTIKEKQTPFTSQNDEEEVRLAPKTKTQEQSQPMPKSIPMSDDYDKKPSTQIQQQNTSNSTVAVQQQKKQSAGGFGGMKGGFLLGGNSKPTQSQQRPQAQIQKPAEDLTHIKAKPKDDQLKLQEVQEAMSSTLLKKKDEWMNADFFQKLQQNPLLLKAFTNPQYMAAMSEFGQNPTEAMKKYGNNPEFRTILEEFSKMMGTHFEQIGDQKAKEEEEKVNNDPVMQIINNDEQVKAVLNDPKVKKVLDHLRFNGALDLHEVMRKDPELGMKMQFLISKGVLNANSQPQ